MDVERFDMSFEEDMIDSLFQRCDAEQQGKVQVSTVIEYLQSGLGVRNGRDLTELAKILRENSHSRNHDIDLQSYRDGVKRWISNVRRNRCDSPGSKLMADALILATEGPGDQLLKHNMSSSSSHLNSSFIETSGIGDGSYHRPDHDIGELLGRIEDLKHQNRKMSEENVKLHHQLDSQEDVASNMASELQTLDRKNKGLQELVDFRQVVMEENEELKAKMAKLADCKRQLESKVTQLERDNHSLDNQNKELDNKKATTDLEEVQKNYQGLHNAYVEQKNLLNQEQEDREMQLSVKSSEVCGLEEKVAALQTMLEKLQEEKKDDQTKLTQATDKLHRLQTKMDLGLADRSSSCDGEDEAEKVSPQLHFSTPRAQHSICVELRDRLDENKHLPSPFCEKLEISTDVSLYTRSAVLPTYMSAWELDNSSQSGSFGDYSLELPKIEVGRLSDQAVGKSEDEKKALCLQNWGRDALQNEILHLHRLNIDLAEKCHKAELREQDLEESLCQVNQKLALDKERCQQLEESLQGSQSAREVDLRDLWRLVQKDVESEFLLEESDSSSLSGSSEFLKEQIAQEIQDLKVRLQRRQAALGVLHGRQRPRCQHHREGRQPSSPLVDALAIDSPSLSKPRGTSTRCSGLGDGCPDCQHPSGLPSYPYCNRSAPLARRNSSKDDSTGQFEGSSSSSTSGIGDLEPSHGGYTAPEERRKDFAYSRSYQCDNDSQISESVESSTSDNDTSQTPRVIFDCDRDMASMDRLEHEGSVTQDCQALRRRSYTTAIENEASSVEEVHIARNRSYSFQNAIEQGKISPTGSPSFTLDSVLENQNCESSWNVPRFSSTPLPQTKSNSKVVNFHPQTLEMYSGGTFKNSSVSSDSDNQLDSMFKSSGDSEQSLGAHDNGSKRMSPCSSRRLSVLLEEDGSGDLDTGSPPSPALGPYSQPRQGSTSLHQQPQQGTSLPGSSHQLDCSAEVWTLSRSQTDSGHSSSVCSNLTTPSALGGSVEEVDEGWSTPGKSRPSAEANKIDRRVQLSLSARKPVSPKTSPKGDETEAMKGPSAMVKEEKSPSLSPGSPGSPNSPSRDQGNVSSPDSPAPRGGSSDPSSSPSGYRSKQIVEEDLDEFPSHNQEELQKDVSFTLSRIRENHLARRRDHMKQMKMPQLAELSEKDNSLADENGMSDTNVTPPEPNGEVLPSIPDEFLRKLGLTREGPSSDELSDQEIENKFSSLSLAFKTDSQTLEKRLEIQERSRDISEQNVDNELKGIRVGLETLNKLCTDPQVREMLSKIQHHINILEKSTARVSSRAEVFGAIQQEKRMSKAVDIMVHHVENIRRVHEREHSELEEARKLLQDSRSLGPTSLDLSGDSVLMRRSASVCQNNMLGGRLAPGNGSPRAVTPATLKALKLLKASRRRVSEIALPKIMGGTGSPNLLHPSSSMDSATLYQEVRSPRSPLRSDSSVSVSDDEGAPTLALPDSDSAANVGQKADKDARSRFQAVVASATVKTAVANTLRRASLDKQGNSASAPLLSAPAPTPPTVSRDNSSDRPAVDPQELEKQKNLEEEAYKKGYEQGLRANVGQDLGSLREQQNNINHSLGEIMDSIDTHMEEQKSLKEVLVERIFGTIPKMKISGWQIRMTMGFFVFMMAVVSVIVSLFPASSAEMITLKHYGTPPV